jgi:hypothetical protein
MGLVSLFVDMGKLKYKYHTVNLPMSLAEKIMEVRARDPA